VVVGYKIKINNIDKNIGKVGEMFEEPPYEPPPPLPPKIIPKKSPSSEVGVP
jgi:hypothetical protein